jgi:uncharacterized protein (DUF2237 family)
MLQHSIKGEFEYWGDPDFINGILAKLDTGRSIGSGQAATGIAIDGYLVKMFTRRIINQEEKDKFVNEIEVSDLLKQRIPNYVSHIYGAKYSPANSYIIYNLLDGLRLDQYLTILLNKWYDTDMSIKRMEDSQNSIEKKQYELLKETHTNLGYVYAAAKKATDAIASVGLYHGDITPTNLFLHVDKTPEGNEVWSTAHCWLIDFGISGHLGTPFKYFGTQMYSLKAPSRADPWPSAIPEVNASIVESEYTKITPLRNSYSLAKIWAVFTNNIFAKYPEFKNPPKVSTGGGRLHTRKKRVYSIKNKKYKTTIKKSKLNVLGKALKSCSIGSGPGAKTTGFFRTGFCTTGPTDTGTHVVCSRVTNEFLEYSRSQGNDLITPSPESGFPGLIEGDRWCLCAYRWLEAYKAGKAPPVILKSTNKAVLRIIPLRILKRYAV